MAGVDFPSPGFSTLFPIQVDRSVTGLVAQQQCVGPLHTPLADVAVVALSPFETVGGATALGEQPIKGLIDPAAGARLAVAEALTNLVFARVTDLKVRFPPQPCASVSHPHLAASTLKKSSQMPSSFFPVLCYL